MNTEELVVQDALDERVFVSGVVSIDEQVWAIYGSIPVDGQVIVAEFDDRAVAESTLRRIVAAEQELGRTIRDVVRWERLPKQPSVARVVTRSRSGIPTNHSGVALAPLSSRRAEGSSPRELTPSFANTLRAWYSKVRGLTNR